MIETLQAIIARGQAASGAFLSTAHLPSGPVPDENAFVTALVVDLLSQVESDPAITEACERALAFLLRCQRQTQQGAFSYYPADAHPAWIGELLPADADDTALCALALFRTGRWSRSDLQHQVLEVLDRYRVRNRPQGAEWFRAGVYPTWLDAGHRRNPIDVCVNINVLVLIALSGRDPRHGEGILEMADAALDWVGDRPERSQVITPYYPHASELVYALERAVSVGVCGAGGLLDRVRSQRWSVYEDPLNAPICGSVGGGIFWTSSVLQAIRIAMQQRNSAPLPDSIAPQTH